MCPSNSCLRNILECDLIWKYGLCRYSLEFWDENILAIKWALNPVVSSHMRRGEHIERYKGKCLVKMETGFGIQHL